MNAEKFVKNEAKSALSGNWVVGIVSVMVLCFIPIIAVFVVDIAYSLAGDANDSVMEAIKSSPELAVFFVVFHLLAVVSVLLLSPLMNGFVRIFSSIADKKTAELSDLFYFFETKEKYIKSVKFMTFLIVRGVLIFIVSEIPALALFMLSGEDDFLLGLTVILAVLGALCAFFLLHRYVFANMLFSYYEYGINESFCMGAQASKKNCKSLIKLSLTFIPWLLSTFFVLPFMYVYPYMTCSYFVAAKYLYQQYVQDTGNTIASNGMIPNVFSSNSPTTPENVVDSQIKYASDAVTANLSEVSKNEEQSNEAVSLKKESVDTNDSSFDSAITVELTAPTENNKVTDSGFTTENSLPVAPDEGGKVTSDL